LVPKREVDGAAWATFAKFLSDDDPGLGCCNLS